MTAKDFWREVNLGDALAGKALADFYEENGDLLKATKVRYLISIYKLTEYWAEDVVNGNQMLPSPSIHTKEVWNLYGNYLSLAREPDFGEAQTIANCCDLVGKRVIVEMEDDNLYYGFCEGICPHYFSYVCCRILDEPNVIPTNDNHRVRYVQVPSKNVVVFFDETKQ